MARKTTAKPTNRTFGQPLNEAEAKKLGLVQARMTAKGLPKKPLTLERARHWYDLSYDELALVIGASDRGHAWHMCVSKKRPRWDYAKWIVETLRGAVTLDTLMDLEMRK